MNNLSLLIVDDDFNKINNIIDVIKKNYHDVLSITQASNVAEAIDSLQQNEYHLMITDLQMPLHIDSQPLNNGGQVLLKSLYRKKTHVNLPMYIVALTQFLELKDSVNSFWNIWHYDPSELMWQNNIRDLVFHISLVKNRINFSKIETVFVEGITDKKILNSTLSTFFAAYLDKLYIYTLSYSAGASWVERQLYIWAKLLYKSPFSDSYLKAVGLFDDDIAGNKSVSRLKNSILPNSAESNTFSILKTSYKYSPILKSLHHKGIHLQLTIEDLIFFECFKNSLDLSWFEKRNFTDFTESTSLPIDFTDLTLDEKFRVTYKLKDSCKVLFCDFVINLPNDVIILALLPVKYLLTDILVKLKLIDS